MDEILFADEEEVDENATKTFWNVLVVDDEPDVHRTTKLALSGFKVKNRSIVFWHAYSGEEAIRMIGKQEVFADLVLMDVVMESATAGLDAVARIRNELGLTDIPVIVIRTGQPGELTDAELYGNPDIDGVLLKAKATVDVLRKTIEDGLINGRRKGG